MTTPASARAEEFLRRIFPGDPGEPDTSEAREGETARPLRGVDERRQQLLEPIGDPDRESW